jgi:hypothetical protein
MNQPGRLTWLQLRFVRIFSLRSGVSLSSPVLAVAAATVGCLRTVTACCAAVLGRHMLSVLSPVRTGQQNRTSSMESAHTQQSSRRRLEGTCSTAGPESQNVLFRKLHAAMSRCFPSLCKVKPQRRQLGQSWRRAVWAARRGRLLLCPCAGRTAGCKPVQDGTRMTAASYPAESDKCCCSGPGNSPCSQRGAWSVRR